MLFGEEVLQRIQEDPIATVIEICSQVRVKVLNTPGPPGSGDAYQWLLEAYALIASVKEGGLLPKEVEVQRVEITGEPNNVAPNLARTIDRVGEQLHRYLATNRMEVLMQQYATALKTRFSYEFVQGDLDRVQTLLNELRQLLAETKGFTDEHRRRLLNRLERLQAELHKRMSDLDHFWGLVGDAGVALGKLGKDAKPLVDRFREIVDIIWRTQARAEELPSSSPVLSLGHDSHDKLDPSGGTSST